MPLVRLLGPIDVVDDSGRTFTPSTPVRRTILALLAVEAGRVVDAERLLDQAWNGEPPDSGLRALRFHISKLRGEVPADLIATVGSGYRLDAGTDVATASSIRPTEALDLWRGDPLSDVESCEVLEHERQRLDELWLVLTERRFKEAILDDLGSSVVGDLTRLSLDHPLREGLWATLAEAHYCSGNQVDALRALNQLRSNLVESLGIEPTAAVQDLERRILQHDELLDQPANQFERVVAGPRSRHNLPTQGTDLFGRDDDILQICDLVGEYPVVSLVGIGGTGKSRLAIAVAGELVERFKDGVWFIALAPIAEEHAIGRAVAKAMDIQVAGSDHEIDRAVVSALSQRELLVVLDNCEHLTDDVADFVDALVASGTKGRVLATSREPLDVAGERVHRVTSLDPACGALLLADRARAAGAYLREVQFSALEQLSLELDGIPLALELAATQLTHLRPAQLLQRLDDRFALLVGAGSRRRQRQQTMHAVLEWSWAHLTDSQQSLLGQLSVFSHGWTLEAAEEVCEVEEPVTTLLGELVRRNLVVPPDDDQYHLLETIRLFAQQQLVNHDDARSARLRHLGYFRRLALGIGDGLASSEELAWVQTIGAQEANLGSALKTAIAVGQFNAALDIALNLADEAHIRARYGFRSDVLALGRVLRELGDERASVAFALAHRYGANFAEVRGALEPDEWRRAAERNVYPLLILIWGALMDDDPNEALRHAVQLPQVGADLNRATRARLLAWLSGVHYLAGDPRPDIGQQALELASVTGPGTQAITTLLVAVGTADETERVELLRRAVELGLWADAPVVRLSASGQLARTLSQDRDTPTPIVLEAIIQALHCLRDVVSNEHAYVLFNCGTALAIRGHYVPAIEAWASAEAQANPATNRRLVEVDDAATSSVGEAARRKIKDAAANRPIDATIERLLRTIEAAAATES